MLTVSGDFSTVSTDQSDVQSLVFMGYGAVHFAGSLKCASDITISSNNSADFSGGVDMAGRNINTAGYTTFAGSAGTGLITLANLDVQPNQYNETYILSGARFDSGVNVTVEDNAWLHFQNAGPTGPLASFSILGTVLADAGLSDLGTTVLTGWGPMPR